MSRNTFRCVRFLVSWWSGNWIQAWRKWSPFRHIWWRMVTWHHESVEKTQWLVSCVEFVMLCFWPCWRIYNALVQELAARDVHLKIPDMSEDLDSRAVIQLIWSTDKNETLWRTWRCSLVLILHSGFSFLWDMVSNKGTRVLRWGFSSYHKAHG